MYIYIYECPSRCFVQATNHRRIQTQNVCRKFGHMSDAEMYVLRKLVSVLSALSFEERLSWFNLLHYPSRLCSFRI